MEIKDDQKVKAIQDKIQSLKAEQMASATEILTQIERQKAALHSKQIEATQAKVFEITAFQKVMNN